ncbi:atrial natriuretic peptide-converting enzyme isoform X1 [Halyomorpha halys]|uniref:atrial natriuretic peptide-converting enzyme isoform X1 n=1 Tax=Halyomorpha halys TaxID=286706 RepID=UPI0006D50BE6|nr:atrial natriuretic peptide-converting enzyme isoform X1 [Halyomorpha halys]
MFFRRSLPLSGQEQGVQVSPRFHYLGDQPHEITTSLKGYNLPRTRTDAVYKIEAVGSRDSVKSIFTWKVLRWVLIPSMILLLLGTAVYTIIWANQEEPKLIFDSNKTTEGLLFDIGADSSYGQLPGKPPQDPPPEVTEPPNDLLTSDMDEFDGNDTDSYMKEEVSFIDRLISSFQENSKKQGTPHEGLSVKQFTSLGETGLRRIPNGHKYGEYQSLPTMTKYLERSTTVLPVSPTLPSLQPKGAPTPTQPPFNYSESNCHSPQLSMCRGIIPWDLTTVPNLPGITSMTSLQEAMPYFELVLESGCSPRARAFLCSLLEPECQPIGRTVIPPCRKACKAVAEECSDFILDILDLSKVFQCDTYPDSDSPAECVNFAKGEKCLPKEMSCDDGTCIPKRWKCNGVKDCSNEVDETNCTICNKNQFACESKDACIPLEWKCDGNEDCPDKSDENNCHSEEDMVMHSHASPCPSGELRCVDGRCITVQQICNGNKDCSDGADEANCPLPFT